MIRTLTFIGLACKRAQITRSLEKPGFSEEKRAWQSTRQNTRLRAASFFLENLWGKSQRNQHKLAVVTMRAWWRSSGSHAHLLCVLLQGFPAGLWPRVYRIVSVVVNVYQWRDCGAYHKKYTSHQSLMLDITDWKSPSQKSNFNFNRCCSLSIAFCFFYNENL